MNSQKTTWYLRKPDGSEYGPISSADLLRWAVQCRIVAGNAVSRDHENWQRVEDMPELEMDWIAHRPDEKEYGPFNIGATKELLDHKVVTNDTVLTNRKTGKSVTVEQVLNEEDLFVEPEPQQNDVDEDDELSEEARREEELYVQAEQEEKSDEKIDGGEDGDGASPKETPQPVTPEEVAPPQNERIPQTENHVPDSHEKDSEKEELKVQYQALMEKFKKANEKLKQLRQELKGVQQDLQEKTEKLEQERDEALAETKHWKKELVALQVQKDEQDKQLEERVAEFENKLEEQILQRQQAEAKLLKVKAALKKAEEDAAYSVAELRKQTAFMKKNTATLQNELAIAKQVAAKHNKLFFILLTVVVAIFSILLLIGKPSCTKEPDVRNSELDQIKKVADNSEKGEDEKQKIDDSKKSYSALRHKGSAPAQKPKKKKHPTQGTLLHGESWPKFVIDGVKVEASPQTCKLVFDEGVFSSLVTPAPKAKDQLREIAKVMRPKMSRYKIIVEGYTDDKPLKNTSRYNGNDALAKARAEVIRKLLINEGKLPAASISARDSGGRKAPYPNNTASNRRRNRTVILRIIKR